jgi:hypothetical protein
MMGGGAFILLKVGRKGPETAKQAEIRLANLLKILPDRLFWGLNPSPRVDRTCQGCIFAKFQRHS